MSGRAAEKAGGARRGAGYNGATMRSVWPSLLAAVSALVLGLLAHHTITTGREGLGLACLAAASAGCGALLAYALRPARHDARRWPRLGAAASLLLVSWAYLELVDSPYFPTALRIAHALACAVLLAGAAALLLVRTKGAAQRAGAVE